MSLRHPAAHGAWAIGGLAPRVAPPALFRAGPSRVFRNHHGRAEQPAIKSPWLQCSKPLWYQGTRSEWLCQHLGMFIFKSAMISWDVGALASRALGPEVSRSIAAKGPRQCSGLARDGPSLKLGPRSQAESRLHRPGNQALQGIITTQSPRSHGTANTWGPSTSRDHRDAGFQLRWSLELLGAKLATTPSPSRIQGPLVPGLPWGQDRPSIKASSGRSHHGDRSGTSSLDPIDQGTAGALPTLEGQGTGCPRSLL